MTKLQPEERVSTAGEREALEAFLDYLRGSVPRKATGVSEVDARRRIVPSLTSLAGLVRHLAAVERGWFMRRLGRLPEEELPPNSRGDDASWLVPPSMTVPDVIRDYQQACADSRRIASGYTLDDVVPHPRLGQVSLRWIYLHMIEETARHAGHADILRELIDGTVGND